MTSEGECVGTPSQCLTARKSCLDEICITHWLESFWGATPGSQIGHSESTTPTFMSFSDTARQAIVLALFQRDTIQHNHALAIVRPFHDRVPHRLGPVVAVTCPL